MIDPATLELLKTFGLPVALYVAIRVDMRWLLRMSRDHEKRIRLLERQHG